MTLVFVYGTLKRGYGNHRILKDQTFLDEAHTDNEFVLYDGVFPYAVHDGKWAIHGEVYDVDDATLHRLDILEGVPYHYIHLQTWIHPNHGDDPWNVLMYVASDKTIEMLDQMHRDIIMHDESSVVSWNG